MREHFEGYHFSDLFELMNQAVSYERLLKEKDQCRNSSKATYYSLSYEISHLKKKSASNSEGKYVNLTTRLHSATPYSSEYGIATFREYREDKTK